MYVVHESVKTHLQLAPTNYGGVYCLKSLTTATLLSTPLQAIQRISQHCVLQGDKTISLPCEVMDQTLCFAPEHHLTQKHSWYHINKWIILHYGRHLLRLDKIDDVTIDDYSVAGRFERGCSYKRVIGFHWNFTRVPLHKGLCEFFPYVLTVISEKQMTVRLS